jgi:hypothetical protein
MSKLYNGLQIPMVSSSTTIPVPAPGKVTIFARANKSVWMKRSDGTEARISVR